MQMCNICNQFHGFKITIGCCQNSIIHLKCFNGNTKCNHCKKYYSDDVKRKLSWIKRERNAVMIWIVAQEMDRETKRNALRKKLQSTIDKIITLPKLYAAFNSKESKEENKRIKSKKLEYVNKTIEDFIF